jgi:hypothetical protein
MNWRFGGTIAKINVQLANLIAFAYKEMKERNMGFK